MTLVCEKLRECHYFIAKLRPCGGIGRHKGLPGCQRLSSRGCTYTQDQKSLGGDTVPVRVRSRAPLPITHYPLERTNINAEV